jgi:hypothetical protein
MTQAFNLAQFANKLNTSGQTDNTGLQNNSITINTTSPIIGGATPALGGSMTIAHATSGVGAATYTAATITVNAQGHVTAASSNTPGTVTSIATGNGLSGGTITTTGTLTVACPTFNTVGSYCFVGSPSNGSWSWTSGSNYAAGSGAGQFKSIAVYVTVDGVVGENSVNNLSGTWKWMSGSTIGAWGTMATFGIACRVS